MRGKRSHIQIEICIPEDFVPTSGSCSTTKVPDDPMGEKPLTFYRMLPLPLIPTSKAFIMAAESSLKLTNAGTLNLCLLLYCSPLDKVSESISGDNDTQFVVNEK